MSIIRDIIEEERKRLKSLIQFYDEKIKLSSDDKKARYEKNRKKAILNLKEVEEFLR